MNETNEVEVLDDDRWAEIGNGLDTLADSDETPAVVEVPAPAENRTVKLTRSRIEKLHLWWHRLPSISATLFIICVAGWCAVAVGTAWRSLHDVGDSWQNMVSAILIIIGLMAGLVFLGGTLSELPMRRVNDLERLAQENDDIILALDMWMDEYDHIEALTVRLIDQDLAARRQRRLLEGIAYHYHLLLPRMRPEQVTTFLQRVHPQALPRGLRLRQSPLYESRQ